jgi:hypothetical protein
MTGHVFHLGHAELHGITVVVETHGLTTYVGRYDSENAAGVHLLDVGVHDPSVTPSPKQEYIKNSAKFGIRVQHKHVLVPSGQIARMTRLSEVIPQPTL